VYFVVAPVRVIRSPANGLYSALAVGNGNLDEKEILIMVEVSYSLGNL
jgi:hypothetical protein